MTSVTTRLQQTRAIAAARRVGGYAQLVRIIEDRRQRAPAENVPAPGQIRGQDD